MKIKLLQSKLPGLVLQDQVLHCFEYNIDTIDYCLKVQNKNEII